MKDDLKVCNENFEPIAEGLFSLPEYLYRRIKALNITYAKLFNRSPLHVWTAINDPAALLISPTYAMQQGTGFHWAALEPERFESEVVAELQISKNSKIYKQWEDAQAGKLILRPKDIDNIIRMVEVLNAKEAVQKYLSSGWAEKCIIWHEDEFDIWCKGRIDWIRDDGQALIDLKKTQVASRWAFEMSIRRYEYNKQAAHYMRGFEKCMGYRAKEWVWIASEIDPPNECNVFVADPEATESAEAELELWYERYAECLRTGVWPGYADEPVYLGYQQPAVAEDFEEDEYPNF